MDTAQVAAAARELSRLLALVEAHDRDYTSRFPLVLRALAAAAESGLPAGFRITPGNPAYIVGAIDLPTGQVAWHLPVRAGAYDGHSTPEKYRRCDAFAQSLADAPLPHSA